jgi:hypothetical protein
MISNIKIMGFFIKNSQNSHFVDFEKFKKYSVSINNPNVGFLSLISNNFGMIEIILTYT